MYPANAYLEKRSPSPTFVNISSPFDYPSPTKTHLPINHHPTSLKYAKTRGLISASNQTSPIPLDQTELIFPDDAYRIEFCMPTSHVICKCPPSSAELLYHQQHTKSRRKNKSKNEISNHQHRWRTKKSSDTPITCQEIINLENYCSPSSPQAATMMQTSIRNHHPPPVYDVYSYAYLEPPPPQPHQTTSSPIGIALSSPSTSFAQPPPLYDGRLPSTSSSSQPKTPSRNSIKALLAKSFRSRTNGLTSSAISRSRSTSATAASNGPISGTPLEKYTYTTRYGTTENLYEEVNEEKIREILSADGIELQAPSSPSHVTTPSPPINSKEEQRRVQNNHFRILDELNLSLEALIMPPTPPDISPTNSNPEGNIENNGWKIGLSGSRSVEDLSSTLKSSLSLKENKDDNLDVDSGFSVSSRGNVSSCYKDNFLFGKKFVAGSGKRSATLSVKKNCHQSTKEMNANDHPGIAMTLISPSSPFKSVKKYFDGGQHQKTTSIDDESCSSGSGVKSKNKFWTIRQ